MAEVRLLGAVEVVGPAGPAVLVGSRQRALLGLLALSAGSVVSTTALVDALWGEEPPRTAVRTLHSHVSRLRAALEACGLVGALVTRPAGYALMLPRDTVDAHRFDDGVRRARADLAAGLLDQGVHELAACLALWRGEAFADATLSGWGAVQLSRLDGLRLDAREDWWDTRIRGGEHAAAIDELDAAAAAHPTRERLIGLLMFALARSGRPNDALEQYRRLRVRVADELGTDPGPRVQQLYTEILRGELTWVPDAPAPAVADIPSQLPPPVGHFAGREAGLGSLDHWLDGRGSDSAIVVVAGAAGIGKTALALQWAHRIRERFPDGQLFLDLRGHDPEAALDASQVLGHALHGLGVPADRLPVAVSDRLGLYRSLVNGRRVLVVLDNAGTADHVLPLALTGTTGLLMVTSRHRLAALVVHHAVHVVELGVLTQDEAQALLSRVLGADRLAREPAAVTDLIRLCDRIPLALRIAAARLSARPRQPIAELVDELVADNRLDALSLEGDSHSLRTVLDGAYRALSEPAARLFRLLGQHPGPTFTAHLAGVVTAVSPGRGRRGIDELAAAYLITEVESGRYHFHDLVRLYAQEAFRADTDERDPPAAVAKRLIGWYLGVADTANRILDPSRNRVVPALEAPLSQPPFEADHESALTFLDGERANVVSVVRFAADKGHDQAAWQLSYLFGGYFESRGHAADRVETYRCGLIAARRVGDPVVEGLMRSGLGVACIAARRHEEALDHLRTALALMFDGDDRRGQGHVHNNLAVALGYLHRHGEAIAAGEEALAVHTTNQHTMGMILALNNLGHLHIAEDRPSVGLEYLDRALALARRDANQRMEAAILHTTGQANQAAGSHGQALEYFRQALTLRRRTGDRHHEAQTLTAIGATLLELGDPVGSLEQSRDAYEIGRTLGDPHLQSTALAQMGRAHLAADDLAAARDRLAVAGTLRAPVPDLLEQANLEASLGELEQRSGRPALAVEHWDRALALYQQAEAPAAVRRFDKRRRLVEAGTTQRSAVRARSSG